MVLERTLSLVGSFRDQVVLVTMTSQTAFDTDSSAVKPGFHSTLDKLADVVVRYGKTTLTVVGHTDSTGSHAYNMNLSLQRADSVLALAGAIAVENRGYAKDIAERLLRTAIVLEHFSDQISRRPARLLTGVTPPPPDSVLQPRDTTRTRSDTTRGGR